MSAVLFLIPARGGSKGLPGKNVRPLAGVPLVGWAARTASEAARSLGAGNRVLCSTDDPAIAEAARAWGAETPFMRPAELASDTASSVDVALHALDWLAARGQKFDTICLVQPTSPLATAHDLTEAVKSFQKGDGTPVVTTSPAHPPFHAQKLDGDRISPYLDAPEGGRRQDVAKTVAFNGAAYVIGAATLREARTFVPPSGCRTHVMPVDRAIDIDTLEDFALCEALIAARKSTSMRIGDRDIGPGHPAFIIAEGGVNHNGDVALARQLIDAAKECGADAVKFQTFQPELLCSAAAPKAAYQNKGSSDASQLEMLRKLTLSREAHHELKAYAEKRGIMFLSTPFDEDSADFLKDLGLAAFKLPSGEVTNHPFLQHVARFGKPMLMSSGMCTIAEVGAAVRSIAAAGNPPLALFHCVSNYPAAPEESNLRAIVTLARAFGIPVGWSDHTPGIQTAIASIALGASLIEKHLTLSHDLPGPDHKASLEPGEFRDLVLAIRSTERALGDGVKAPRPSEHAIAAVARKSLHWRVDLDAGAVVDASHVIALRPGTGVAPFRLADLVGRKLKNGVRAGAMVADAELEGSRD